jgi:hypothetical protein
MQHAVIMVGEQTYLLSGMVEEHVMGPRTEHGVPVSFKELEDKGQARSMQAWRQCLGMLDLGAGSQSGRPHVIPPGACGARLAAG